MIYESYHTELHCYLVIELEIQQFKSEFAGKLGYHVASIDGLEATPKDNPGIDLLLCPHCNEAIVERSPPMSVSAIAPIKKRVLAAYLHNYKMGYLKRSLKQMKSGNDKFDRQVKTVSG